MINIDKNIEDADWTKRTWDLHNVKTKTQLLRLLKLFDISLDHFKTLPIYKHNKQRIENLLNE